MAALLQKIRLPMCRRFVEIIRAPTACGYSSKFSHHLWEVEQQDSEKVQEQDRRMLDYAPDYPLELSLKLQRERDISIRGLKSWIKEKMDLGRENDQRYIAERLQILGADLAAAHFIVHRGGAVKFIGQDWVRRNANNRYDLPKKKVPNLHIEAIDASNTAIITTGLVNFELLSHVKWLSFRNCKYVDDWFLDRLGYFKDTLEYLDISGCPDVTGNGVAVLHRFRKLKVLNLENIPKFKNKELTCLLLEEVLPECEIRGVDYMNTEILSANSPSTEA